MPPTVTIYPNDGENITWSLNSTTQADPWSSASEDTLTDNAMNANDGTSDEHPAPESMGVCVCLDSVYKAERNFSHKYALWLTTNHVRYSFFNTSPAYAIEVTLGDLDESQWVHKGCVMTCFTCAKTYKNSKFISIEGNSACVSCAKTWRLAHDYIECRGCVTLINSDDAIYSDWLSSYLCNHCDEGRFFVCNDCGYENTHDVLMDHDCEDRETSYGGKLHPYNYRPTPIFHGVGDYHFGIEIEIEDRDNNYEDGLDIAYDYLSANDRGYLKEDGSLSEGFEIVSHPHTLVEMQTKFPWDLLKELQKLGFRSWNTSTCGVHVHVSKKAFWADTDNQCDAHEIRFMKLIYDNEEMSCRIAGRDSSRWASFSDKGRIIPKVKNKTQTNGRYSAINSENENTHEVRIFRGSLRPERVLCAVEFVAAAVEYTRNMKVVPKNKPLGWARFSSYITENADTYPNLFLILSEIYAKQNPVPTTQQEEND